MRRQNPNLIKNRATQSAVVIDPGMIERAEERQPRPLRNRREPETEDLELAFSLGLERSLHRSFSCEGFDHHGPVAPVLRIPDHEFEIVRFSGDGSDDLGYGALPPADELHRGFP